MMTTDQTHPQGRTLRRSISPLAAWALAFGSSVGWGSFVMPGTTFLPLAGPLGAVIGLLAGAIVMLIIGVNYAYLTNRYPKCGGAVSYVTQAFGYDHGFLCAWFLLLTYTAIAWANATALPIIARNLLGSTFQFGPSYTVAGFSIYLGEVGLAIASLVICGFICQSNRRAAPAQSIMAVGLIAGIIICFVAVKLKNPVTLIELDASSGLNVRSTMGALNIIALAPWAYVGFESISHTSEEFTFSTKKTSPIIMAALVAAGAAYALLVIIASSTQPNGFANLSEYLTGMGELDGVGGLPTFFAASNAMGNIGTIILGVAAFCAIGTGLIGNYVAASRLLYFVAEEGFLPSWFARLNEHDVPGNAVTFIMCISLFIPFFGRTAISWIVDVTTVGAAIAYAYTSACAWKTARNDHNTKHARFGIAGMVVSALFLFFFLAPNFLAVTTLSAESYLILATWSILGFACFRMMFVRDKSRRLGHSTFAWIVLLALILFTSLVWMRQSTSTATVQMSQTMQERYLQTLANQGTVPDHDNVEAVDAAIDQDMFEFGNIFKFNTTIQMVLIVVSLGFMFDIYSIMQRRQRQTEIEKALAEESNKAKTSFLSNMSHEIRTPMNAIIGLDSIALKDPNLAPHTRDQLEKIGASANHLLGLINDILDMSRIESGRMVLKHEEFSLHDFVEQIGIIIGGQCQEKGLTYECNILGHVNDYYVGDDMKLKQVLINILGNAVKFTEAPGTVSLAIEQTARVDDSCTVRFVASDTGIGMDADYIPKLFDAFTQEDGTNTNRYGGSGLGMAITKNFVEMMGGDIQVESEKGVGSTFTVTVTLGASDRSARNESDQLPANLRVLVIDDDEVACAHAQLLLTEMGVTSEICQKSTDGLAKIREGHEQGSPYGLVITDYLMPELDGVELTREIRALDGSDMHTIVFILTAYNFEDMAERSLAAGVDAVLDKPLFTDILEREIRSALERHKGAVLTDTQADEGALQEAQTEVSLEGRRILLAEDIEINAEIMMDLLDMEEMEAEHAENGQVVVDMFTQSESGYYDAILMDIRMPVMDGLTATGVIRQSDHPDAKTIPIIALTANAFDEDVQNSLQAGMNAHLSKPVEPDQLYTTLRTLIGQRE